MSDPTILADDVVCITGGCGFLGQQIVTQLLDLSPGPHEIRLLDIAPPPIRHHVMQTRIQPDSACCFSLPS